VLVEELSKTTSVLRDLVGDLDTAALSGAEAARGVEGFSLIAKLASAGVALCARQVASKRFHEACGHTKAESWLSERTGVPTGAARSLITTARQLSGLDGLDAALRNGELSPEQAAEVARGATADASLEAELLERARSGSLRELKEAADRAEACARSREEDEARHARIRANRHLRSWLDPDGSFKGRFALSPEDGALFLSGIEATANHLFDLARRGGVKEPRQAYLADALVAMVSGQVPATSPATAPWPSGSFRARS
jgi:hypothetical protein